ncbi:hypothetical protein PAUR_b0363 [Pseudoalteromonas aurantia 208]|uniref:Uncharacterized protein n=1 Tax=Pseudoalteromonas aurantia 208 TaxID=1314867 RepID=A0ABR9EKU7_9GAMM|nr:hypothetical protein [Pseudoalteromonas aurantia 208]
MIDNSKRYIATTGQAHNCKFTITSHVQSGSTPVTSFITRKAKQQADVLARFVLMFFDIL